MVEEIVVRHAQPLDDAQLNERLVSVSPSESDPRLSLIRWHGNELPVHAAKDRVSIGEIAPGLYVALVGGVRRSLDVYFLEASGAVGRVMTNGGRRLPQAFNGGRGSWPAAVGRGVFVVPFEKDGRIELRLTGFGEQVFATRTLPDTATGFRVHVDRRTYRISVELLGVPGEPPLQLAHPRAPRAQFAQAVLDFGEVVCGEPGVLEALVYNPGIQPIEVELHAEGEFACSLRRLRIDAGQRLPVPVTFTPRTPGEHRGSLVASHASQERPLALALRGRASEPATRAAAFRPVLVPEEHATERPAEADRGAGIVAPAPPEVPPAPAAPVAREPRAPHLSFEGEWVVVRGLPGEVLLLAAVSVHRDHDGRWPLRQNKVWRVVLGSEDGQVRIAGRRLAEFGAGLIALRPGALSVQESNLLEFDPPRTLPSR